MDEATVPLPAALSIPRAPVHLWLPVPSQSLGEAGLRGRGWGLFQPSGGEDGASLIGAPELGRAPGTQAASVSIRKVNRNQFL